MILRSFADRQTAFAQEQSTLTSKINCDLIAHIGRRDFKDRAYGTSFGDNESVLSYDTSRDTNDEVASLAETIMAGTKIQGIRFDSDPSLVTGTITIAHETVPRFVPVRIKYDTGSDANFIPSILLQEHGLAELVEGVSSDDGGPEWIFLGLNQQEYAVKQSITLYWCSSTMRKTRKSVFHVIDDMGYDLLLGNPFIIENDVFRTTTRSALPITFVRKHRDAGKSRHMS